MGHKQIESNMVFTEVSVLKSMEHIRSLKRLKKISPVFNWSQMVRRQQYVSNDKATYHCRSAINETHQPGIFTLQ